MYTKQQLAATFERIGLAYDPAAEPTEALAGAVQYAFQKTVPYENLDILRGIPLSLDYDALYDKIVTHHRGGYCFEINGFLGEVYRSLGFGVTEYMARFLRGETEIPMRRHRVLAVRAVDCAVPLICDAGIGQSAFRLPLHLEDGYENTQYGETYRVERQPFYGWVISDWHKGAYRPFYSFTEEEQLNIDYVMPSFWCEHAPESPFTSAEMFSIKTDTGRITLDANKFHLFDGENVTERILSEDEVRETYGTVFGLPYEPLPNAERFPVA